jgi:rhamnose utilization protein RhaD (predicted bifunctional aldolase and dehydrogenase)
MHELVSVSRRYGKDRRYVVAGGGNTSYKTQAELFIKASGSALDSIDEGGFVNMDRRRLSAIWAASYPADEDQRESAVLADLMASRYPGQDDKRPSVETLLHDALPFAFVVHTHPALVNGIGCSLRGQDAARELFGDECLWIPSTNPGYILSKTVRDAYAAHTDRTGKGPSFILLQNHGIFVAADSVAGIDAIYARVMDAIAKKVTRQPDFNSLPAERLAALEPAVQAVRAELAVLCGSPADTSADKVPAICHATDPELLRLTASSQAFASVARPFTPDHIVYAGSDFLYAESGGEALARAYAGFVSRLGRKPKLAALKGLGVFGIGEGGNEKSARLATELFRDAATIAAYTEAFGGAKPMSQDQIDFINNWEVERYRSKVSTK